MNQLQKLARALQSLFPSDPSAPCVQLAWLGDKEAWYCSLCRFTEPFGQGRQVLWKGMDKDYDALCVKASEALSVNLEAVVA